MADGRPTGPIVGHPEDNVASMNGIKRPEFSNIFDMSMMGSNPGYTKLQQDATRQGPSDWAQSAANRQMVQAGIARDQAGQDAASQAATARSQLAMRGGLTGGARERLGEASMRNALEMNQGVNQQLALGLNQVDMTDEQNRMQQLGQFTGMENSRNQFLANAQMGNQQARNLFDMTKYQEDMRQWAANRQAQAIENSSGGK
jgi:hypothetical protein